MGLILPRRPDGDGSSRRKPPAKLADRILYYAQQILNDPATIPEDPDFNEWLLGYSRKYKAALFTFNGGPQANHMTAAELLKQAAGAADAHGLHATLHRFTTGYFFRR